MLPWRWRILGSYTGSISESSQLRTVSHTDEKWEVMCGATSKLYRHICKWLRITSWWTWNGTYPPTCSWDLKLRTPASHQHQILVCHYQMKQFVFPSCTCGPYLLFLACYFIPPTAFCADTVFFYTLLACTQTFKHVSWQTTNRSDLACFWDLVRWQNKKLNVRWSECYMQLSPSCLNHLLASSHS